MREIAKELEGEFNWQAAVPEGAPSKDEVKDAPRSYSYTGKPVRSHPLIEHAYPWRHSAEQAANDLQDCGWTKEAEAIAEVLSDLPTGPVDGNQPEILARQLDAIRAGAERIKAILTTCLEEQPPAVELADAEGGDAKHPPQPATPPPAPVQLLATWRDILIALGMRNNSEDKQKVDRLNETYNGPIKKPGQGRQPLVGKAELIDWWNNLTVLAETQNRTRDAKASVGSQHNYGREGKVVPDISGAVKKRRKDRRP